MMRKNIAVIILVIAGFAAASSQEVQKKAELSGYLTTMQSVMFDSLSGSFINENLIHNRLNFKGYLNDHLTFAAEVRNRLFTGDMVRLGSSYSGMIGADQGWIDMSWNLLDKKSFLLNTTIDRLWFDARYDKFQMTIGRQRINWGQTFVWNPNDIFNAYSFFDFDYVERPGSDAVRLQYFPSFSSAAEVAVKVDNDNDITAAGMFRFNKWGYDLQFLAGYVNSEDLVIGTGWSGAIGSASFRGEISFFQPFDGTLTSQGTGLATMGFDKVFKNNSMVQLQVMYCNNPMKLNDFTSFYTGSMSAKDLAFSRFSAFAQFTWAATPLLNIGLSSMWFPDIKGWFAGPSVDYSLSDNIGFSLLWQHFYSSAGGERTRVNIAFLRIKYSF